MTYFGWNYPAGAENDPSAPYNAGELILCCDACGYIGQQDEGDVCEECEQGVIEQQ